MSNTHIFPVNIFNLEGGETMLARDKGNFHAPGKNRTRDPPVQWLERPINMYYYICTEIYCKMNMSNKNDALQSTRNLIGCAIFLTSEKYRMTNHNPQTKVFTSDKNRIDFPAFH